MPLTAYEQFRKEMTSVSDSMPSVGQLMRYSEESFNANLEQEKLFPSHAIFHLEPQERGAKYADRLRLTGIDREMATDLALKDRLRQQRISPISEEEIESESKFKEKERSYEQKEANQEKAAMERNESFSGVQTKQLLEEADDLRAMLAEQIDENDSYAMGEREYQKQFLAAIEDLVKTRASKGKMVGNYKSHIALAEEKYLFYSKESTRIIGREQAKILMNKPDFQAELDKRKNITPSSLTDMDVPYDKAVMAVNKSLIGKDRWPIAEKAMKEYNACTEKICTLRRHIGALKAAEELELAQKQRNLPVNEGKAMLTLLDQRSGPELFRYIQSLEREMKALMFEAEACKICVDCLKPSRGMALRSEGFRASHAAFIRDHFGVEVMKGWWYDPNSQLRGTSVGKSMGFEMGAADVAGQRFDWQHRPVVNPVFRQKLEAKLAQRETGYERQFMYEYLAVEANSAATVDALVSERRQMAPDREALFRHTCNDMLVLTRNLPVIQDTKEGGISLGFDSLHFNVTRNEVGERVLSSNPTDVTQEKDRISALMHNIEVLRTRASSDADVKRAIQEELPHVSEAFDDIDAFMNVGATREIFTAKNHFQVFDHTAGLPTFTRKARTLRDVISLMLRKKDVVRQVATESGQSNLHRDLLHKWMYLNRVLSFVQYRTQLMEKGYNSTRQEWTRDTTEVEGFFEKHDLPIERDGRFDRAFLDSPEVVQVQANPDEVEKAMAEGRALESEQAERNKEARNARIDVPSEDEEPTWSEEDKQQWRRWKAEIEEAYQTAEVKHLERDEALEGLTRTEKRYLRLDLYESPRFKTRKEQRDAISQDLLKGTCHSAYVAELISLSQEMYEFQQEIGVHPTQEQQREMNGLIAHKEAVVRAIESITEQVADRTDRILKTIEAPKTDDQEIEESLNILLKQVHTSLPPEAMDETLRIMIKSRAQNVMRFVKNPQAPNAMHNAELLLTAMVDSLREPFREQTRANADASIAKLRGVLPNMIELDRRILAAALDELQEKLTQKGDEDETLALVAASLSSLERKYTEVDATPLPPIFHIRNSVLSTLKALQGRGEESGRNRRIQFNDTVEVVEGDREKGYTMHQVYTEEIDALTKAKKEQRPAKNEALRLATDAATEQKLNAKGARGEMLNEAGSYTDKVSALSKDAISGLDGADDMEEGTKELLSDIISIFIPMDKVKDDDFKLWSDEAEQKADMMAFRKHVTAMEKEDAPQQDVMDAVDEMVAVIRSARTDLGIFLGGKQGSKMIEARRNINLWRRANEPVDEGNLLEDLEGVQVVKIKAQQLRKLTGLTIASMDRILEANPDYKDIQDSLKTDMLSFDSLIEFLEWRETVVNKLAGAALLDHGNGKIASTKEYVQEARDYPEEFSHEKPFVVF